MRIDDLPLNTTLEEAIGAGLQSDNPLARWLAAQLDEKLDELEELEKQITDLEEQIPDLEEQIADRETECDELASTIARVREALE